MTFDATAHQNLLSQLGNGPKEKQDDSTNDGLSTGTPKRLAHATAKTMAGVVGLNTPVNIGAALDHGGIQQGLETGGFAEKTILPAGLLGIVSNINGGPTAKLVADVMLKNLTMGIGGGETVYSQEGGFTPSAMNVASSTRGNDDFTPP